MDFDVSVEQTRSCLRTVTVTIAAAEVEGAFVRASRKVARTAALPGFRAGKVPKALVQRHFATQIHDAVQEELIDGTLYPAFEANEVASVGQPQVSLGVLKDGAIFTYTATVEVRPEVVVDTWQGLTVPRLDAALPAAAVDAELERLRREDATMVPVSDRDVAQQGDLVLLDYEGRIDGALFPGGRGELAEVEIGAEDYIPGFAEGLVGCRVPGTCEVPVRFPDNYGTAELAGKQAVFSMRCHELKARVLPALDDAFAADHGHDSLAALRESVHARLGAEHAADVTRQRRSAVADALVAANPLELPPSLVRQEAERMVEALREDLAARTGKQMPLTAAEREEMVTRALPRAEHNVRAALLLYKVGELAEVVITDDDIDAEIEAEVARFGEHGERLRASFASAERREDMRYHLRERRTLDRLLESAVDAA